MKGTRIKYRDIQDLPPTAQKVANYAKENKISICYVYKLHKKGSIEIVNFQGFNFVLAND